VRAWSREQVKVLKHHRGALPVLAQRAVIKAGDIRAVHQDTACRWPLQQIKTAQQRAFARAAAPQDPVHRALRNGERDVVQRRAALSGVSFAQPVKRYHDCGAATGITEPL